MSWKVCVCSDDGVNINQHFGRCQEGFIYLIDNSGKINLLEKRFLGTAAGGESELPQKVERISDCNYVLCAKIGNHAVRLLAREEISALECSDQIVEALQKLFIYVQRMCHGANS